jgi:hypothetical protein
MRECITLADGTLIIESAALIHSDQGTQFGRDA